MGVWQPKIHCSSPCSRTCTHRGGVRPIMLTRDGWGGGGCTQTTGPTLAHYHPALHGSANPTTTPPITVAARHAQSTALIPQPHAAKRTADCWNSVHRFSDNPHASSVATVVLWLREAQTQPRGSRDHATKAHPAHNGASSNYQAVPSPHQSLPTLTKRHRVVGEGWG